MFSLKGKRAIVTGGGRGLGYAMAEGLLEAGAEIMIFDMTDEAAISAEKLNGKGLSPCHFIRLDVTDRSAVEEAVAKAKDILGSIDILVNAAGIQRRHPSAEFPPEDWDAVINVNLTALFFMCQQVGKIMLKQGKGKIINIASMLSFIGGVEIPAYAASKGGVSQMSKTLSNEWAGRGVNVNCIAPGYMHAGLGNDFFTREDYADKRANITARIPVGRWGEPDDLKGPLVFLASDASDYVSGVTLPVDGGYLGN